MKNKSDEQINMYNKHLEVRFWVNEQDYAHKLITPNNGKQEKNFHQFIDSGRFIEALSLVSLL